MSHPSTKKLRPGPRFGLEYIKRVDNVEPKQSWLTDYSIKPIISLYFIIR
jgi:hypothetical protein